MNNNAALVISSLTNTCDDEPRLSLIDLNDALSVSSLSVALFYAT